MEGFDAQNWTDDEVCFITRGGEYRFLINYFYCSKKIFLVYWWFIEEDYYQSYMEEMLGNIADCDEELLTGIGPIFLENFLDWSLEELEGLLLSLEGIKCFLLFFN